MGKTKRLADSLIQVLRDITGVEAVYFRRVPAKQEPPFVVFLADGAGRSGDVKLYDITLEVSGYVGNAEQVDDLMDTIEAGLDAYAWTDEHQSWQCFTNPPGEVESSDPLLTRRRMQVDLRYLDRSMSYESEI